MKAHTLRLLAVSALYFSQNPALAADLIAETPEPARAAVPENRIANHFEAFAGSPENATSLVAGLRSGREITLRGDVAGPTVSFTPTTRPMGYGNISRSLTLAQEYLATQGITQPTPEQLRAALDGGTLSTIDSSGALRTIDMPGVLHLRSQGMGWGRIAQRLGVSPGNRPVQGTAGVTATPSANRAFVEQRGSGQWQGAIVSGDGSFLQGRAPGYGSAGRGSAPAQARASAQAGKSVQRPAGMPTGASAHSSISVGRSGHGPTQARGNGRF